MAKTLSLDNYFPRTTVGFDRLFSELERQVTGGIQSYPPFNIVELNDNEWMISIAVSGFAMDNLTVTHEGNTLMVEGNTPTGGEDLKYLHKGIAARAFRRQFALAEHVEVKNAIIELGMLNIHLLRNVPEELQAKKIQITTLK